MTDNTFDRLYGMDSGRKHQTAEVVFHPEKDVDAVISLMELIKASLAAGNGMPRLSLTLTNLRLKEPPTMECFWNGDSVTLTALFDHWTVEIWDTPESDEGSAPAPARRVPPEMGD